MGSLFCCGASISREQIFIYKDYPKIVLEVSMLISKDVDKVKIPRIYISKLLEDEMFYLQIKYPQIIYSHETALYLHCVNR